MSRMIIGLVVVLFSSISISHAGTALEPNLKACVSGLKAVENYVRDNKPELNPDYFRSLYGWEAFKAENKSNDQFSNVKPSSMSDIKYCSNFNLDGAEINFLMSQVYDLSPDNPEDELANCYSSFYGMAGVLNSKYGEEKAGQIGFKVGHRLGQITHTLNTLYKNVNISKKELEQKSIIKFKELFQLPKGKIVSAIEKNAKSCRWFDIPLMPLINGLEIGAGKATAR